jgi:hypothetical protein
MGREAVSVWRLLAAKALPLGSGTTAATLTWCWRRAAHYLVFTGQFLPEWVSRSG